MSTAEELLKRARVMGAIFHVVSEDRIEWEVPIPLPDSLLAGLRAHKPEILYLLSYDPDYEATACICDAPNGPTGALRCGTCGLQLIYPTCGRCRGCKLRRVYPPGGQWR